VPNDAEEMPLDADAVPESGTAKTEENEQKAAESEKVAEKPENIPTAPNGKTMNLRAIPGPNGLQVGLPSEVLAEALRPLVSEWVQENYQMWSSV
jgi:hypothetical protein